MTPESAARLERLGIQLMAEAKAFMIFARETCVALVHSPEGGPVSIGSSGMITENGLAYLVWRGEQPVLVVRGTEVPAGPAEIEAIRRFAEDLKSALA